MSYYWDRLEEYGDRPALISEEETLTYRELAEISDRIAEDIPERSLAFIMCRNRVASVAGFVAFARKRVVPMLLDSSMDSGLSGRLMDIYRPQFIWCPEDFTEKPGLKFHGGYKLVSTGNDRPDMNENLALLVTTSGSTGSPKCVRLSHENLQANTESIAEFLGIVPEDKAITTLPMNYVYGLSVIQTHLMAGAGVIVTEKSIFDNRFWSLFRRAGATTFGAVPYIYQMLDKLQFLKLKLPSLKYVTQAGGKLGQELHHKFARGMSEKGRGFVAMYGASEATARMSYVPHEMSVKKAGSIGIAIPGGRFELVDSEGHLVSENNEAGELVYYGSNVMLGYAECREDLKKGDELQGRLETGDLAMRDADGYYYIIGRKNRFLKIYGNRINLMETEEMLKSGGYEAACTGEDDHLRIYTTSSDREGLADFLHQKTGLDSAAFSVTTIREIPRSQAGKVLYSRLQ